MAFVDIGTQILRNILDFRFAIDLPDPRNHLAMKAFNMIMTTKDLQHAIIYCDGKERIVDIELEYLAEFSELIRNKR
jgi:hypothetical protein